MKILTKILNLLMLLLFLSSVAFVLFNVFEFWGIASYKVMINHFGKWITPGLFFVSSIIIGLISQNIEKHIDLKETHEQYEEMEEEVSKHTEENINELREDYEREMQKYQNVKFDDESRCD